MQKSVLCIESIRLEYFDRFDRKWAKGSFPDSTRPSIRGDFSLHWTLYWFSLTSKENEEGITIPGETKMWRKKRLSLIPPWIHSWCLSFCWLCVHDSHSFQNLPVCQHCSKKTSENESWSEFFISNKQDILEIEDIHTKTKTIEREYWKGIPFNVLKSLLLKTGSHGHYRRGAFSDLSWMPLSFLCWCFSFQCCSFHFQVHVTEKEYQVTSSSMIFYFDAASLLFHQRVVAFFDLHEHEILS
jgi:hypothetical protein